MNVNSKMTAIADAIRNLMDINEIMGLDAMASNISSITKRGAVAGTISEKSEQYIIPSGYHNGSGTVEISPDEQSKIIAENIKNGVTILGVAGSASGEIYSVIAVTYPEGSVCTCSNGTKTLKARDNSGKALFNVTVGEWTVSCTDGSSTVSKDVTIAAAGQVESVTLSYQLYLYNYGDKCENVTGGWEQYQYNGYGEGSWAYNSDNIFVNGVSVTNSATVVSMVSFDPNLLSQFSQLKYTVSVPEGAENKLVILANKPFYENIVASVDCNGVAGTYSISLDNISSGWPALFSYKGSQKVHAVWLE